MRTKIQMPQWVPTALLILLVPVIGYLAVSNIEQTRQEQDAGAQTDAEAQLLGYMRQQYDSKHSRFGFHWKIGRRDEQSTLVCYCDKKGYGWWYQVQTTPAGYSATEVADTSAASSSPQMPSLPQSIP